VHITSPFIHDIKAMLEVICILGKDNHVIHIKEA